MTQTVLLAGATGMLGGRIAHHLLTTGEADLRLLVRPGGARREQLAPLLAAGATVVPGDLTDPASLDASTGGVDVVVSAVQGGRDVVVDGQVALAEAAVRGGVRRYLPSDFALDLYAAPPGEVSSYDLRREAGLRIQGTGLEVVHVLNGAFLDLFVQPRGVLDLDDAAGTATFWGEGTERFEATTVEDTAHYAALAALDRDLPPGKLAVAGDRLSALDMVAVHERVTGRRYRQVSRGGVTELEALVHRVRAGDPDSPQAVVLGYLLHMLTGRAALTDLANDRYPQVRPRRYAELVEGARSAA
ncbi:NmrA family NAD(P)-binding protein [Geodermatophilus nigrescens]|uniref:Nucleoside-diphosphate-sugar epimerase n=1 Tax=Geodermatophilus nigrescens TaxID=1070870 RepID=A0A1M5SFR5_9ACTN|nr:NmrA family NAD(P)-binding protein [Geodermatophilus nigrescens]SHH37270.1 Nucleoside-diphosphate-sugar epimerase [Geodermatophilus nigrescens]